MRRRRGALSPEGYFDDSFDYDAVIENLLKPLGPDGSGIFRRAVFDFRTDAPVVMREEEAPPNAVLLFDGVFLLRPELRGLFDYAVFVRRSFQRRFSGRSNETSNCSGTLKKSAGVTTNGTFQVSACT